MQKPLLEMTMRDGIETVWDRFELQQPPCKYYEAGLSCPRCTMGPCRIIPPHRIRGVSGADADLIVARNLLDTIATGSAAHSDHGRDLVETLLAVGEGKAPGFGITDPAKLDRALLIFIEVLLDRTTGDVFDEFAKAVAAQPDILECHMVAGGLDYLIKARVKDMAAYRNFLGDILVKMPGVRETRTYAVLEEVKNTLALPI